MKTIIWDADDRELPGYGIGRKGQSVTVPDDMAESYIKQGLAKANKPKKPAKEDN